MSDLNKVIIIGRLVADPELTYVSQSQTPKTKLRLAVNRKFKDSSGELKEEATFVTVSVWNKQAESCNTYLHKGSKVFVEGRLRIYSYGGDDGTDKKYATEIVANDVGFLDTKPQTEQPTLLSGAVTDVSDEEVPF